MPADAFEDSVRPPDVEPRSVRRVEREPEPVEFVPEPPREAAPPVAPREEAAPDVAPRGESAPDLAPRDEATPERAARGESAPDVAPRDEVTPERAARGESAPDLAPRGESAPDRAPHNEVAPDATPRDDAPDAAPHNEVTPDATPSDDTHSEASRLESASEAARRDPAPPAADSVPREPDRPVSDHLHQPTVEYTPFQTEEHEAPLGDPRADEPEIRATRAAQTATAEHDLFDEPEEEPELSEPKPLRAAPPREEAAAPRKRPAPNAPRRRRRTPPPPKTRNGGGNGGRWARRGLMLVVIAVILVAGYVANATFQPFHGDGEGTVKVSIPENSDADKVGQILVDAGVIDSARFFVLNATVNGSRSDLRPGDYTLQKGMSNEAAIDVLTKVPEKPTAVPTVDLTLVEGPSRKENAPVVDKSEKVKGDYAKASASDATLKRIRELGAPKGTKTSEGFLFPATYTLPEGSSAQKLVDAQLDAFEENFKSVDLAYAKRKKLTRYDVLIIASLIEREASLAKERKLVSAVIYNRLSEGIPLGIDATTRYSTNNWTRSIKQSELDKDEPFNTRLNRGLPPTPIGNPGLASIKAAAKPSTAKKYLYYVRKSNDDSGEHVFTTTYAEFEKARLRYEASRGGG
ncbi:endolytic transglycosylase MltG [Solirubrobacter phytolaccae]|uniref:Endolytic murein transglycosylase n=1 Tax=Solirubrobacter phytolaccae TaxID=1404360 RepID=A0A9X3N9X4_9ACTN|nr:endolytic transglycosylase MltG [Solirubrobacter phytolaccae]MDA0178812.1 endolytic transglycosylase MltG [Solirubrobacter phytolaccae]